METAGLAALVTAVADVADFVGADWRDVVPVTNATTGVNAVLQSLKLQKGDLILMTNATYAAVRAGDVFVPALLARDWVLCSITCFQTTAFGPRGAACPACVPPQPAHQH
jgi:hypothetical protein